MFINVSILYSNFGMVWRGILSSSDELCLFSFQVAMCTGIIEFFFLRGSNMSTCMYCTLYFALALDGRLSSVIFDKGFSALRPRFRDVYHRGMTQDVSLVGGFYRRPTLLQHKQQKLDIDFRQALLCYFQNNVNFAIFCDPSRPIKTNSSLLSPSIFSIIIAFLLFHEHYL